MKPFLFRATSLLLLGTGCGGENAPQPQKQPSSQDPLPPKPVSFIRERNHFFPAFLHPQDALHQEINRWQSGFLVETYMAGYPNAYRAGGYFFENAPLLPYFSKYNGLTQTERRKRLNTWLTDEPLKLFPLPERDFLDLERAAQTFHLPRLDDRTRLEQELDLKTEANPHPILFGCMAGLYRLFLGMGSPYFAPHILSGQEALDRAKGGILREQCNTYGEAYQNILMQEVKVINSAFVKVPNCRTPSSRLKNMKQNSHFRTHLRFENQLSIQYTWPQLKDFRLQQPCVAHFIKVAFQYQGQEKVTWIHTRSVADYAVLPKPHKIEEEKDLLSQFISEKNVFKQGYALYSGQLPVYRITKRAMTKIQQKKGIEYQPDLVDRYVQDFVAYLPGKDPSESFFSVLNGTKIPQNCSQGKGYDICLETNWGAQVFPLQGKEVYTTHVLDKTDPSRVALSSSFFSNSYLAEDGGYEFIERTERGRRIYRKLESYNSFFAYNFPDALVWAGINSDAVASDYDRMYSFYTEYKGSKPKRLGQVEGLHNLAKVYTAFLHSFQNYQVYIPEKDAGYSYGFLRRNLEEGRYSRWALHQEASGDFIIVPPQAFFEVGFPDEKILASFQQRLAQLNQFLKNPQKPYAVFYLKETKAEGHSRGGE